MADTSLDVQKAEKKMWIVKLPNFLANYWRPICKQALEIPDDGEVQKGPVLGSLKIGALQKDTREREFTLEVVGANLDIPSSYRLKPYQGTIVPQHLFSERQGKINVEGFIDKRFDGQIIQRANDEIDPKYRKITHQRLQATEKKVSQITKVKDLKRIGPLPGQFSNFKKMKLQQDRETKEQGKKTRMDQDKLEKGLFMLFEKQPRWLFNQLAKETQQPAQFLKDVLSNIADQHKRGPYKEQWELKAEYQTSSAKDTTPA